MNELKHVSFKDTEYFLCFQDTPTLRSCWSRGQQVVVSYGDQQMVLQHPELWAEIPYW